MIDAELEGARDQLEVEVLDADVREQARVLAERLAQAEFADRDAAVEDARLEGAVERHHALAQLQARDAALERALELRPAEGARQQGDADRPDRRIEAHVHLVGPGMPHAQRVDREPAVEYRDGRRLEQAEMPASGGERQVGGAELEAPEPAGVPREPRLEQRVVDAAGERGARRVVEPVEVATRVPRARRRPSRCRTRRPRARVPRASAGPPSISTSPRMVPSPATSRNALSTRNGCA